MTIKKVWYIINAKSIQRGAIMGKKSILAFFMAAITAGAFLFAAGCNDENGTQTKEEPMVDNPASGYTAEQLKEMLDGFNYDIEDDGTYTLTGVEDIDKISVTVPECIKQIASSAFILCKSLISVTVPDSVTEIKSQAFYKCTSLVSVTIADSVKKIGAEVFSGCSNLKTITLPSGLSNIDEHVFKECKSLETITIPASVTEIGKYAFEKCSSLTGITIGEKVTSIGDGAFNECAALAQITIPASVTVIGNHAFDGCLSSAKVYYKGTEEQWKSVVKGNNTIGLDSLTITYSA